MVKKLGKAFSEELETYNIRNKKHRNSIVDGESETTVSSLRILTLSLVLTLVFGILGFRLYHLMIVSGAENREASDNNRIRLNVLSAPRGILYDRNGIALVRNNVLYKLNKKPISRDEALKIETSQSSISAKLEKIPVREYIYGDKTAHLLGYMTEATEEETKNNKYNLGEKVGRFGVEEVEENKLKGVNGRELVEVDALGRTIKKLGEQQPTPGVDLRLTIDSKLQTLIADNFPKDKKGAVVATNPQTGEVLALYSSPSFDPQDISKVFTDTNAPLFDRVISGTYPPGSPFKIITASAGLENGLITKDIMIEDTGVLVVGPYSFSNWYWTGYGGKEGFINIVTAIKRSNDIFFYKLGEMDGLNKIEVMAKRFGLGSLTGIDLPHESKGLVPTEDWKQQAIGEKWYLGDTYHLAIGQGYLHLSPIQVNQMTNVIASGGKLCRPHLTNWTNLSNKSNWCQDIGLKKQTVEIVREGMKEVCQIGGTAWPFFDFKIPVGCKTGTAEFGDPHDRTHAWFTVFAPFDHPKIAMTVLVEGAGEGSNIAAPIAKKVLEEWLK